MTPKRNVLALTLGLALGLADAAVSGPCPEVAFDGPGLVPTGNGAVAVAGGDIDDDGDMDAVVSGIGGSPGRVALMLNDGGGNLAPAATHPPTPGFELDVALGDLNGDGRLDIVLASFGTGVTVLVNLGGGEFAGAVVHPIPGMALPRAVAAADMDGDGDLDIVAGDAILPNHVVLLNDGTGEFSSGAPFNGGAAATAVAAGDLDGDGDNDLVFVSDAATVHLNRGDATFEPPVLLDAVGATSVALGDLDGDGALDVVVSRAGSNAALATVFLNRGGALFQPASYPIDALNRDVALADLNGDGYLDIATSHVSNVNRIDVLLNRGDGTFQSGGSFFPGVYPQSLAAADVDGDGLADLLTANEFASPPSLGVLINRTPPAPSPDLDGDGAVGVVDLLLLLAAWGPTAPCAAGDLDGDGLVGITDLLALLTAWG